MNNQENINFYRIKKAIEYISSNYKRQPDLEEISSHVNVSAYHFHRLFSEWAGVSPKQFLQYVSIEHAKKTLKETHSTLFGVAEQVGLSGTGRLHDLFISIEGMTPGEYKHGGINLTINYSFSDATPFGRVIIASTSKGICHLAFIDNEDEALLTLTEKFPKATYIQSVDEIQNKALAVFSSPGNVTDSVKLHIKGTPFQLKVWEALLKIPQGNLTTYGDIATFIGNPRACRAVGSAVGDNPIAFLIPCHRVIQSSGVFGQYMWGSSRKTAIIGWEKIH